MGTSVYPFSKDSGLEEVMRAISSGDIQLPEFQRNWTWDDYRIRGIIASITQGYPIGAITQLEYGNRNVRFKYRPIEGAEESAVREPKYLILDGQQRLTAIYRSAFSHAPTATKNDKGAPVKRFYYLDIAKCLDENAERIDAVVSVPEDRKTHPYPGHEAALDLSSPELEYGRGMFPMSLMFDNYGTQDWADGYKDFHGNSREARETWKRFAGEILRTVTGYRLPMITLTKDTPREAVCKIFENVNTGGVVLTVFELVTASFAADDFDLRADWEECRKILRGEGEAFTTDLLDGIDSTAFLSAVTLYATYTDSGRDTSCKKRDVLSLRLEDYRRGRDAVLDGFRMARNFLMNQCIFSRKCLPYTIQITPLAVICAVIGRGEFHKPQASEILSRWYWCGVLGEMYGGATDTRLANDVEDVIAAIRGADGSIRTVSGAFFSSARLLSLQSRTSAAYNGIMALMYKAGCRDFMKWTAMSIENIDETADIHHIFPKAYCERMKLPREKWNSVVNKIPLLAATNRAIGGDAPSVYSKKIMAESKLDAEGLRERLEADLIDFEAFMRDDFGGYFAERARRILGLIESAMGRRIADRGSEETIKLFGESLAEWAGL
ncbi:MAG: DUF262 domain-containing protein [Synergistaceae bacterium]|nr:DUF262 domain-containing protein [Synergistaceae bacterium]